jgi:hypothetical protein
MLKLNLYFSITQTVILVSSLQDNKVLSNLLKATQFTSSSCAPSTF